MSLFEVAEPAAQHRVQVGEVARTPQQQRIFQRLLEMAVGALDRAVLVCDAGIVARRLHLVVPHQALITLRQILLSVDRQITERSR